LIVDFIDWVRAAMPTTGAQRPNKLGRITPQKIERINSKIIKMRSEITRVGLLPLELIF